ncbi:MAG TPA: LysR substrate-binding domain-containing protein [Noviherbaspirillum sp.]|nr:LysR substrate-binding domain-containing protein [Noviherbaspirillum sp.]
MHFDLTDLRLFVYIAEENSLTRAAVRAHMSLPAASVRIKNLEDSIGTKLINRDTNGITLRPPGQALLQHARQVLRQLENLRGDMQEYAQGIKGHVRIFANTTATAEFLPAVLRNFLVTHSDVNIDLREHLSPDVVRAVSEGIADIGIAAGSVRTEGLEVIPYRKDRLVLATATNHPLAKHSEIDFTDTLEYDYIGLYEGSVIHSFVQQAAGPLSKSLKTRIQVSNFDSVCRMIEANVGIGILPESAARRHAKNLELKIISLTNEWASRNLIICVRDLDGLPGFARELVDMLVTDAKMLAE